jgi:hypothetical protein
MVDLFGNCVAQRVPRMCSDRSEGLLGEGLNRGHEFVAAYIGPVPTPTYQYYMTSSGEYLRCRTASWLG